MTTVNRGSWCVTVGAFAILVATAITGCQTCPFGQEIVIPSSDVTAPSLVMDLHLPNGSIVTVTPGSTTSTVPVPGGGKVTVIVNAKDPEGVKDVQIWSASIITTIDPNTGVATRQGPGLLGAPSASNADSRSSGQKGCTERVVSENLEVSSTPQRVVSFEVGARGVNFGGRTVRTPTVTLQAQ
jgi:hypothetical protein